MKLLLHLNKYRSVPTFNDMCIAMKMKFSQYCKNVPLTFCLAFVLDLRGKWIGVETLSEAINNNMNVSNVNNIFITNSYLEQLLMEYSTKMSRPETPSTPLDPP